jgi:ring-1,2-phenylacetyl-CoA epoxidase subunit PaaE
MASFHELIISDVIKETPEAVSVTFDVPIELKSKYIFLPGQYLTLESLINNEKIRRDYSISSTPSSGNLTVTIKKVKNGIFSNYANDSLRKGSLINVSLPRGRFVYDSNSNSPKIILAFAAGSGITPIISIIKTALENSPKTSCKLIYGNKSPKTTIFLNDLNYLKQVHKNRFDLQLVYSQAQAENSFNGRIDAEKTAHFLQNLSSEQKSLSNYYLCGPEKMIFNVKNELLKNNIKEEKIFFELFSSTSSLETKNNLNSNNSFCEATIQFEDSTEKIKILKDQTVLDAALSKDIEVPYSCKGGVCSSCICRIKEGGAQMRQNSVLTDKEVEEGLVLSCQAVPTTANLIVDFDDV